MFLELKLLSTYAAFICHNYPDVKLSILNQVINNKCTAARWGKTRPRQHHLQLLRDTM